MPHLNDCFTKSCRVKDIHLASLLILLSPDLHLQLHLLTWRDLKGSTLRETKAKAENVCKIDRWTVRQQPQNDCGFLMSRVICSPYVWGDFWNVETLAQSPLKLAQTLRVISDVEVTLRLLLWVVERGNDAYQSFSFLLGNQPPTGCPTLTGRRLSEHWHETQIGALQWFISFSVCLSICWKFHARLIWGNNVTFWHFDY